MAATGSLFAGRPRTGSTKPTVQLDVDGNEVEVYLTIIDISWQLYLRFNSNLMA